MTFARFFTIANSQTSFMLCWRVEVRNFKRS